MVEEVKEEIPQEKFPIHVISSGKELGLTQRKKCLFFWFFL